MGFDVSKVTSDATHYESFICRICNNLANLESGVLVTSHNHVYCESCLMNHAKKSIEGNSPCLCRVTRKDLITKDGTTQNEQSANANASANASASTNTTTSTSAGSETRMQVDETHWIAAAR
eukprot:CAMPEP_0172409164 /NCGR_PEP_ID=MMETSP1061-20121228/76228_1 /TAXON_ID=37318 /ORGANISM="Pseudo-nitzschia pungens, Strain cf. pungens" /LENGTH=121 /DNA_ID=CAMNT_0013145313 /DNA_START=452 /DNA_END=814 /DNA_ORIENTATION=+